MITFDEGHTGDQRISTILVSDAVAGGFRSAVRHDHYSLLRTLEASWGLGCLGNACTRERHRRVLHGWDARVAAAPAGGAPPWRRRPPPASTPPLAATRESNGAARPREGPDRAVVAPGVGAGYL